MSLLLTPSVALAGGDGGTSILSTLARGGSGNLFLRYLDTRDATALRATCREAHDAVAAHPWDDVATWDAAARKWAGGTRITRSLSAFRACFPRAVGADVRDRTDLVDADFVHLAGVRRVNMSGCTRATDDAFVHLAGIHSLDMSGCNQMGITDTAFAHLGGIYKLRVCGCTQAGITNAGLLAHVRGVRLLSSRYCDAPWDSQEAVRCEETLLTHYNWGAIVGNMNRSLSGWG